VGYTLKSDPFGIGTPTFCFAVDSDGTTVKDFASASVTSTMTRDAGTSIASATYQTKTLYGVVVTSTAFVNFTTNLPSWDLQTTSSRSVVVICSDNNSGTANSVLFGQTASDFVGYFNGGTWGYYSAATVDSSALTTGVYTRTLAAVVDEVTNANCYVYVGEDGASVADVTTHRTGVSSNVYSLSYLGRKNDNTTSYMNGTIYLVAFFPGRLTMANVESIHADPYGALFDSSSASIAPLAAQHYSY
jgi:hypothetical protein